MATIHVLQRDSGVLVELDNGIEFKFRLSGLIKNKKKFYKKLGETPWFFDNAIL